MKRKNIIIMSAVACTVALALYAAETITGDYNTSLGYLAGTEAYGERMTVMGAGAGGKAESVTRTDFFGAACGTFSKNITDSVGMGYRALRYCTNMNNVVGIGAHAFEGRSDVSDATWINGQFYAEGGTFWIKPDPTIADENAPIYYSGGNLYLNAGKVITKEGTTISGGGTGTSADGYDWYVSASDGNDHNDGTAPGKAFKTLDAALAVATNHQTVGVLAGRYAYPEFNVASKNDGAAKPVTCVAIAGPDRTFIDKSLGGENEGVIIGCKNTWTRFTGFTFKGCRSSNSGYPSGTATRYKFLYGNFINCIFEDCEVTNINSYAVFGVSVMEQCKIRNFKVLSYGHSSTKNLSPAVFEDCVLIDCEIDVEAIGNDSPNLSDTSHFENCFVTANRLHSLELYYGLRSGNFGTDTKCLDSTVLVEALEYPNGWGDNITLDGRGYSDPPMRFDGCLVGIDGMTNRPAFHTDTVIGGYSQVSGAIEADTMRADRDHQLWYFYGYGAFADRRLKNVVTEAVLASIATNQNGGGAQAPLMASRPALMAASPAGRSAQSTGKFRKPQDGTLLSAPGDGD